MSPAAVAVAPSSEDITVWIDPALEALTVNTNCAAHSVVFELGDEVARQVRGVLTRSFAQLHDVEREDADLVVAFADLESSVDVRIQLFSVEGNIWIEVGLDVVGEGSTQRVVGRGYVEGEIGDACTRITPLFDIAARQAIEQLAANLVAALQTD